jgi:hypothetical protein
VRWTGFPACSFEDRNLTFWDFVECDYIQMPVTLTWETPKMQLAADDPLRVKLVPTLVPRYRFANTTQMSSPTYNYP